MNVMSEEALADSSLSSPVEVLLQSQKLAAAKVRKRKEVMLAAGVLVVPTFMTLLAFASLFWRPLTLIDLASFMVFYGLTSLGVTMGYHRLLTHNSFKCSEGVKWFFTVAAAMSVQGPAIWWVAHHRKHHIFSDKGQDVHSPHFFLKEEQTREPGDLGKMGFVRGFLHAHLGWMLEGQPTSAKKYAGALFNDRGIQVIDRLYFLWVILSFVLPVVFALGLSFLLPLFSGLLSGQSFALGLSGAFQAAKSGAVSVALGGLLWGGFVRVFALHHATWSVNSVCHLFGKRPFATNDASRNNAMVALLTAGEGWHNGHHAFPASARHGLLKGQIDLTWICIKCFEKIGLAWAVKTPSELEIQELMQRP